MDYFALSLPLLLAFAPASPSRAHADLLAKLDVTDQVDAILERSNADGRLLSDEEASDLQKMVTRMAVKGKAQGMVVCFT